MSLCTRYAPSRGHLVMILKSRGLQEGGMQTHPGGIQEVIGAGGLDDLGLLLHAEVLPGELGVHVGLVQLHDLVVADGARVGVVHDPSQAPLGLHVMSRRLVRYGAQVCVAL
jgi:hypothetical protein